MIAMKVNIFWQLQTWHSSAWIVTLSIFTWTILSTLLVIPVEGKKCPGKCIYNVTDCKEKGGKVAGYCTNELACCDYSYKKMGSCGSKMNKLTTAIFRSPDYPEYSTGDLVCQFDFNFNSNATGIIVEYSDILMDGRGFMKNSACESDMFVLKGFPDWTPPIQCGNMSNYAAVIDLGTRLTKGMRSLTILALMSSKKYRWNIKVTQLYTDRSHPSPKPTSTTTEISAKRRDKDDSEDEEEEDESPYDLSPNPKKNSESTENYEESEDEELHRILHITSSLKLKPSKSGGGGSILPAVGEYIMPGVGDESQQDYNYPGEETFIVNGDDTEISTVPWQASLRTLVSPRLAKLLPQLKMKNCTIDEGIHFCGGSIISDRHILSATHCFLVGEKLSTWQRTSSMKIVLGDSNLCDENHEGVQELKVERVYYHYAYDTEAIINDMVVIKVDRKIRFTSKIKSVKMADVGMKFEHEFAFASGWGLTNLTSTSQEHKGTPDQLQSADDMFIGNSSDCMEEQLKLYPQVKSQSLVKYPKYGDVFSSLICTYIRNGSLPRVVGQGDSGGPLVVYPKSSKSTTTEKPRNKGSSGGGKKKKNKSWEGSSSSSSSSDQKNEPLLVGVISYMIPVPHEKKVHDVSNYIDFYQSVPYYRKWIDLAMQ